MPIELHNAETVARRNLNERNKKMVQACAITLVAVFAGVGLVVHEWPHIGPMLRNGPLLNEAPSNQLR